VTMTTTQRPRPSRPAAPTPNPASRGVILVVVAVVLGLILLVQGGGVGFDSSSDELEIESGAAPAGGEVEAPPTTDAEPTSTSVPPAALSIVALNAAGVSGYAGQAQQFLNVAGYTATGVGNAATQRDSSVVYFAPGFEVDAATVAGLLGLELANIAALPEGEALSADPAEVPAGTNVVVVLGPDVAQVIEGPPVTQSDANGDADADATS